MDLLDLLDRATAWTHAKVVGAQGQLDAATPCADWDVRAVINHLLAGQHMFAAGAAGGTVAPPSGEPPDLIGDAPASQYEEARVATIKAFSDPGVMDGTVKGVAGDVPAFMIVGIAVCDQLIHGWDLAVATGQDTAMPPDLAAAAWMLIGGRISDEARGSGQNFDAAVAVPDDAGDQAKLLGYCGRTPQ